MNVEMMPCIGVGTIIYLIRVKGLMDGFRYLGDVSKKGITFFIAQVSHFTDMVFIGDDAAARMTLFFKQD